MFPARGVDWPAALGAAIGLIMLAVYVSIMRQQGDPPLVWVLVLIALGVLGTGYGSVRRALHRGVVLLVSAALLGSVGLLAILTIGVPILLAALLCALAATRMIARRTDPASVP